MNNLTLALTSLCLFILIVLISSLPIGLSVHRFTPLNLSYDLFSQDSVPIHYVTITNTVIPRTYALDPPYACLFDSRTGTSNYLPVYWRLNSTQVSRYEKDDDTVMDVQPIDLLRETKEVRLEATTQNLPAHYDTLYLFLNDDHEMPVCADMIIADYANAEKITIV